ncbi:MAG: right-handed parallel beta-helix repeat-containing protein, partial [Treponema sp.]|nr:right-handed parallel beta-helix repeat-containing protein [Treponema sp.]
MLAKIDAEIAWANAARLNVTVAYPQQWGTSLQRGTGRAGDTRVGYAFDIDFTPDPEYTFIEWRAYDTNELNRLYPNWINQNNVIRHLRSMPMLNDVDLPKFDLGGGSGKVKVNSDKILNITLVPVSSEQPRIARSTPDDTTEIFQSARAISIVFAAPLRANTVIFARDHIEISSQRFDPETGNNIDQPIAIDGLINEETRRYANPLYNTMTNTITINPVNNGPEAHSIVTLRLGRQILSSNGSNLTAVTIRWKTGGEILTVIDPEAVYNSGSQEIIVTWDFEGPVAEAEVNWFINEDYNAIGSSGPITAGTNEYRISGVTELDITDITSLEIYEISISLFNAKGDEFEMDFDPLMVINAADSKSDAGITFIYDEDDLKNVSGYGMFFLREDINVYDWTPLGRTEPFRGIFHGLGKTITINSFANLGNNASYGVFETIEFAKISNLNVDYKDFILPILNPTNNNINAGGIAATMRHNNTIVNCTIRNGYKITLDVDTAPNSALWTINGAPSLWLAERQINDAENAYLIQTEFAYRVTNPASDEDTQGTLRHALKITHTNVSRIIFDNVEPGETTLTLATELPPIDKSLTIEGNGITLTRSWTVYTNIITQQLIRITSSTATVKISRVHFNNGRATNDGAAIYSSGNITLESCIFSGNQTSVANAWGAAVYNSGGKMTVKGCTFYNNTFTGNAVTTGIGGAIYSINSTASLILSGNLFYGNAGGSSNGFSVVRIANGTVTSEGYNVVDVDFGTASNRSGFNAHINGTDKYVTTVPISPYDAKLRTGGGAQGVITTLPPGYPT